MSMTMSLIWPLGEAPPPQHEAEEEYAKLIQGTDAKALCAWITDKIDYEPCLEIAQRHNLKPFLTFQYYPNLEESGYEPDAWFTPQEMKAAAETVLALINGDHPDGVVLRDAYAEFGLRDRYKTDSERDLRKAEMLSWFVDDLKAVIEDSERCERSGIDRVVLCAFD